MAKMRTFTFTDGDKVETKEAVSYKKAVKSFQSGTQSKFVKVEWEAKKGDIYEMIQPLPMGRSKKLGRQFMKLHKGYERHISTPKKTSQSGKKRSCKMSSMNKSKKRSLKFYKGQGK